MCVCVCACVCVGKSTLALKFAAGQAERCGRRLRLVIRFPLCLQVSLDSVTVKSWRSKARDTRLPSLEVLFIML